MFNGLIYNLVISPDTGRVWLDRNLGATQVCTSSTDSACYGDLYQWGRAKDGHESRTSATTVAPAMIVADLEPSITPGHSDFITTIAIEDWIDNGSSRANAWKDGGVNNICPAGFSPLTDAEMKADTISATTTVTNANTAFSSFLNWSITGRRNAKDGVLHNVGLVGSLWSVSNVRPSWWPVALSPSSATWRLSFLGGLAGFVDFTPYYRSSDLSVRCIKA